MKMKFKLDGPTIKEFLFKHVEKIILGVVALLLAGFVWLGTRLEGMTDLKSPDQLMDMTKKAKTAQIDNEKAWDQFKDLKERHAEGNVPERVVGNLRPTDPNGYLVSTIYNPPDFAKQSFRADPKIYAPLHLQVTAIQGPLAVKRDPDAQPGVAAMNVGPTKDPLSGDLPVGANANTGVGGYGESGVRPPVSPPPGTRPKGKTKTPSGLSDYGPEEVPYPMYPTMDVPGAGGGNRDGGVRGRTEGFLPGGTDATFVAGRAVVVVAAVPWEQQFDEYQRTLSEALDYRPERDFPNYLSYQVQRADVTADPSAPADKLKWAPLSNPQARKETYTWAGFPAEVIDPDWCDLELTHPAPPFLFRDLTDALRHPEFPLLADSLAEIQAANDPRRAARAANQQPLDEEGLEAPVVDPRNPEAGRMQLGAAGIGRIKSQFQHKTGATQGGVGPGGTRMEGSSGFGGPGGAAATAKALEESVRKFKLLRFTDVTVQPGKIYRYRVNVLLEDPNCPRNAAQSPATTALDNKVKARLAGAAKRQFFVSSDWSEASPPIALPQPEHFYAVNVTPPSMQPIIRELPPFVDKDASAKALAVVWSEKKAVDVPGVAEVHRGSVLTFVKDAEVVHPISATPRKISDFQFTTEGVVADMRGGETIKARDQKDSSSLKTPGEMLVFDNEGNWHALDETYDADARMKFVPEEETEDAPKPKLPTRRTVPTRPVPGMGMGAEGAFRGGPPGSRTPPGMQGYPQAPQQPQRGRTGGAGGPKR